MSTAEKASIKKIRDLVKEVEECRALEHGERQASVRVTKVIENAFKMRGENAPMLGLCEMRAILEAFELEDVKEEDADMEDEEEDDGLKLCCGRIAKHSETQKRELAVLNHQAHRFFVDTFEQGGHRIYVKGNEKIWIPSVLIFMEKKAGGKFSNIAFGQALQRLWEKLFSFKSSTLFSKTMARAVIVLTVLLWMRRGQIKPMTGIKMLFFIVLTQDVETKFRPQWEVLCLLENDDVTLARLCRVFNGNEFDAPAPILFERRNWIEPRKDKKDSDSDYDMADDNDVHLASQNGGKRASQQQYHDEEQPAKKTKPNEKMESDC